MSLFGRRQHSGGRKGPRPERYLLPVCGAAVLFAVWLAVAHASGSGWVQALAAAAAGAALVGLFGPRVALSSLELRIESCPRDAVSGEELVLVVRTNRGCRCTPLHPGGRATLLERSRPGELVLAPPYRGTLAAVVVEVSSAAPFGLLWWSAPRRVELPSSVTIAPSPAGSSPARADGHSEGEGRASPELALSGDLRGVREYRLGDSPRLVHWRATAHTGSLMTREHESDTQATVRVVADLSDDPEAAEREAGAVLQRVIQHRARGAQVVLETTEAGRRVAAEVADARVAGRRLARAGRNPWAELAEGAPR